MDHRDYIKRATDMLDERGREYGNVEDMFTRIAAISTLKLNVQITPYMVATIMESVKDARLAINPSHQDSHIDGINYRAFRAELASRAEPEKDLDELSESIKQMAAKLAPAMLTRTE
jgi:hypothetical protein